MDSGRTPSTGRNQRGTYALVLLTSGLIAGLCGLLGVGVGGAMVYFGVEQPSAPAQVAGPAAVSLPLPGHAAADPIAETVAKVGPGVVTIVSFLAPSPAVQGQGEEAKASGSGFIISDQGYIVTNNHVVDGAAKLEVILADGTTLSATLTGVDPFADIAVVQVAGKLPSVLAFGYSEGLKPGESVIAFGSPGDIPRPHR